MQRFNLPFGLPAVVLILGVAATPLSAAWSSDLDSDGDVDLTDFSIFSACFNGPNRRPACE